MNVISKAFLLTGVLFASNAFAMEASYDCVRAKMERICNPCKSVRIPRCCERDTVCASCPSWDYCRRCAYQKVCRTACSPCARN